jgi:AbrB family looped-hinge helix DNA binding protein
MAKGTVATTRLTRNYQVSIPKPIRDELHLDLGIFFEVRAERGRVVLKPKILTDMHPDDLKRAHAAYDEAKADAEAGRLSGPFDTADELVVHLDRVVRRRPRRRTR